MTAAGSDGTNELAEEDSPAAAWEADVARRALDELFSMAGKYRSSEAYRELITFIGRFRFYSPFNAMLIHVQVPGATFVAPARRWIRDHGRSIKVEARPIVILQPMGPVMFVFDVSDTVAGPDARPLPPAVLNPFEVRAGHVHDELERVIGNAKRDGIDVAWQTAGSQCAGSIRTPETPSRKLEFVVKERPEREVVSIPVRYEILVNSKFSPEEKYATMAHELGHLYAGHLGTPNERWWPDRRGLPLLVREFEAESICYLVCTRLGLSNPSDEYLAGYTKANAEVPPISLECVMKAAGLIEQMSRERLKPRKKSSAAQAVLFRSDEIV